MLGLPTCLTDESRGPLTALSESSCAARSCREKMLMEWPRLGVTDTALDGLVGTTSTGGKPSETALENEVLGLPADPKEPRRLVDSVADIVPWLDTRHSESHNDVKDSRETVSEMHSESTLPGSGVG